MGLTTKSTVVLIVIKVMTRQFATEDSTACAHDSAQSEVLYITTKIEHNLLSLFFYFFSNQRVEDVYL